MTDRLDDWRPIETANFDAIDDVLISDGEYVTLGWYCDTEGVWMDSVMPEGSTPAPPTHWQPKPAPPRKPAP